MTDTLPTWSVADVHESLTARTFVDSIEQMSASVERLEALFDHHDIRITDPRTAEAGDGVACAAVIEAYNHTATQVANLHAFAYSTAAVDTRNESAQAALSQIESSDSRLAPLLARFAEWVNALGADALAAHNDIAADHLGPMHRLAERAAHQMNEGEEHLYASLATTGSAAWARLHREITSQLGADVVLPGTGTATSHLPMPAVRGLATDPDPIVRQAAYDAEMEAWPQIATACAAAMNAIKGEANAVNGRRGWETPLDASLYANSVSRATFDAMQSAITASLPSFRSWMRTKATLHHALDHPGDIDHGGALAWRDLFAPVPVADGRVSWTEGVGLVRNAFATYSASLAGLVDRAIDERWIDAGARDGKVGGAFCMPFVDDRSLVLLNWSGSVDSAQTTAHELGHAYHNTQLAQRTPLQKRLPMALAETASIFCETLVVEAGLAHLDGAERLALLDVDLIGSTQVVVDIRSRLLFETEVFARRQKRTLGISELNEMMREAQVEAYGDGLDHDTCHPYMWIVKPHYYSSHFYNWPYTYGLLFGLGLFSEYRSDPERFRSSYDDLLSRAGMNTAEELGTRFGFDVTDEAFWHASLQVIADRVAQYGQLAESIVEARAGSTAAGPGARQPG